MLREGVRVSLTHSSSARDRRHPAHSLSRHVLRHFVPAVELTERHVVPHRSKPRDDDPAARFNGKNLIGGAMRHEETWTAVDGRADHEPRREREDAREYIAVGETERQR